jgi:hypothetical protein
LHRAEPYIPALDNNPPDNNPVTLAQFLTRGTRFAARDEDSGELLEAEKFLRYALTGVHQPQEGGDFIRDELNVEPNLITEFDCENRIFIRRDYDSLIGHSKTLPYLKPLRIFPIPRFVDTLTVKNHLYTDIAVAVS